MKDKLLALEAALKDAGVKSKLFAFADQFKSYHGKILLGRKFKITRDALVTATFICGETSVGKFFDGEDLTVDGRKLSEWLAECEKVEVK